jgi:hypothetical protein
MIEDINSWLIQDGVIGSDIAELGIIRFNFPSGRLAFEPYD